MQHISEAVLKNDLEVRYDLQDQDHTKKVISDQDQDQDHQNKSDLKIKIKIMILENDLQDHDLDLRSLLF